MDAAIAGFKGVARRMAGQAVRKGVTVAREPRAAETYYRLLEESAKRWGLGRPHLPPVIFDALVELGGDDVEIWIARYNKEAIAGGVMLYGSTEAFFWSAAMRGEYSSLRPSNLLNVEMIKWAVERGMHWYNLGASEGLAGVERFKESLGAQPVDYVTFTRRSPLYENYRRVRSGLTLWRQPAVKAATM
jgi:lipid II:glycine glycyltransferase (peptidoglycan interpeptide bridge formation enzyme)